ncbi:MAG TPA: histidine kinase, partial [Dehalococcoidia bacterium]|nr:histidine kinase [Dehalococcoidia bacterium]
MNVRMMAGHKRPLLIAGAVAALGLLIVFVGPSFLPLLIPLAVLYGAFRFVVAPLPRFVARIRASIRWKVLVAISVLGAVSILATIVNLAAMDYMHNGLHDIQDLWNTDRIQARIRLDSLEEEQHGPFFSLLPLLSILAALLALGLGVAMALSVIQPVRRMSEAMRRIAAGDFSQPVRVENRDELGELAARINQTASELAQLQEAALADERARALRERIAQVTAAQEEERRRISRELHDGLGPSLAALANRLRACHNTLRSDPDQAEHELEEVARSLKGHVQEVRQLIYDLRPLAVDQLGLAGAVQQQLERFSKETGIRAYATVSGAADLDPIGELTVFRVVQECLSNVQKHAGAGQVDVTVRRVGAGLEVSVQDDGRGFDPMTVAPSDAARGV